MLAIAFLMPLKVKKQPRSIHAYSVQQAPCSPCHRKFDASLAFVVSTGLVPTDLLVLALRMVVETLEETHQLETSCLNSVPQPVLSHL